MSLLRAALTATVLLAPPAFAADARGVLATPRQRVETADFVTTGRLVRVDSRGTRTSYGVSIKAHGFPGVLRVLLEVNSPAAARAKVLLEMRFDGQSSIRIAHPGDKSFAPLPFEEWSDGPLGSGFAYEDFLEQQYFWPGQSAQAETTFGARNCDVLASTPGAGNRTHYAEVKTWLDHQIGFPVYVEKTLKKTGEVKEFTYFGLRHNGGVWSASQVEEKARGQADETLLIIDRGNAKANLGMKDFSGFSD
ncbi:MAG: outer membrane lipoprotein-sorting protein [Terracidiphilus sp.]